MDQVWQRAKHNLLSQYLKKIQDRIQDDLDISTDYRKFPSIKTQLSQSPSFNNQPSLSSIESSPKSPLLKKEEGGASKFF